MVESDRIMHYIRNRGGSVKKNLMGEREKCVVIEMEVKDM